jgi:subtilisin family serine protease
MRRAGVVLLLLTCGGVVPASGALPANSSRPPVVGAEVERALSLSATARVVILLDVEPGSAARRDRAALRREVGRAQDRVLAALHPLDLVLRSRPQHAPILAGEIGRAGLERLRRMEGVRRIDLELEGAGLLAQSVPIVGADAAWALGYTGTGIVVGMVDSGIDTGHPDLAGATVAQACLCHTNGGCCPNGTSFQTGPGAAEDGGGHGTMVAGIMTSDGHQASRGVAPAVEIVAVRVLDDANTLCCMSDVLAGLDWILDNRPDVAAINVSVGTRVHYPGECDDADAVTAGMAFVINALRVAGIPVFAASGNDGHDGTMVAPACVSGTVSVGATYDAPMGPVNFGVCAENSTAADQVACFTDSNAFTDLFAPGISITTTLHGGGVITNGGTSFSAPHATACAALLKQADPSITGAAIEATLKATGRPVTDPKNDLTFPRIDCLAAILARSCPDADGDEFWEAGPGCPGPPFSDCDDDDPSRSPGTPEACDAIDNDCDGVVDDGFDTDGDGHAACFDNCPADGNPGQDDRDQDAQGDVCDLDDGTIGVWLTSNNQVAWQQETGFDRYDLYRGDLASLADTDADGAAQDYGACFAESLPGGAFLDAAVPPVGQGFLYLVTGRFSAGESDLGSASSGAPRPNIHDCATVFGLPPGIHAVNIVTSSPVAICDVTTWLLGRLCTLGVPGAVPDAPVVVHGGHTEVRIETQVTDPDGAPPPEVTATLLTAGAIEARLLDDGSATTLSEPQRTADAGLDCQIDPPTCACSLKTFDLRSGDLQGADTTFTRTIALVDPALPTIVQDCVMQDRQRLPIVATPGQPVTLQVSARDAEGHVTQAASAPSVLPGGGSYACSGDACGCCLLTATDPLAQCRGLPGIASPDFPSGLCRAF